MKIPYDWIKEFTEIKHPPKKIAFDLTSLGFETEVDKDVLDIEVTPNRGDCLSVLGIARELSAKYGLMLNKKLLNPAIKTKPLNKEIKISFAEKRICPRYTYRIIDGLKIKPSPFWLQRRLIKAGLRPINNVVDVTNYVMLETGQPLHAFDYQKIDGRQMIVRRAKNKETIVTLDGMKRVLSDEAIVIQDKNKIIDLAGIMGGKNSEVDQSTNTIILQAAILDPVLIRRTSKSINLTTEASYRYERGVDFEGTTFGLNRATELILQTAGGQAGEMVDLLNSRRQPLIIKWNHKTDVRKILGFEVKKDKILKYLSSLGFCVNNAKVIVPSWRADIKIKEDLVEEVARLFGYSLIPKNPLPKRQLKHKNLEWEAKEKLKDYLVNLGFSETKTYPYLSRRDIDNTKINPKDCLEISNPLSEEHQYLRTTLLPGVLKQVAKNPWFSEIKLFEIGHVFRDGKEEEEIVIVSTSKNEKIKLSPVPKEILEKFKIRKNIYFTTAKVFEFVKDIKLPKKIKFDFKKKRYKQISSYPPAVFDLAILVKDKITPRQAETVIRQSSPYVFLVELFDIYKGKQIPSGYKSLAFHITLSSSTKTLSESQMRQIRQQIILNLEKKIDAQLRI